MEQQIQDSLFQAIKKDDVKAFNALMEKAQCGAYRLGRFPVLSLLYLYRSRKILSEYEESFLKITVFEELREPIEVSNKFSAKAGKCLRLYLNEIVTPLEMLLILNRTTHLKRVYPMTKPSSSVKGRLKAIYSIRYSLGVRFAGDSISLDRRPLSYREKKKLATLCVSVVLIIAIAIAAPVTAVSLMPKTVDGEVTTLSDIRFDSAKEFTLKQDIYVPENYVVEKMNCSIKGAGKKLILGKGATLGELNGKVSDVTIESAGNPIFTSLTVNASIENVIVNVNADIVVNEQSAFVVLTNYGTIQGVTVNVSGKVEAVAVEGTNPDEDPNDFAFGGIVQNNSYKVNNLTQIIYKRGIIHNCTVNYSQFTLKGSSGANATFGGVAGVNDGFLQYCTVNGDIVADTFDIAGVCSENNWGVVGNENNANLSQTSAEKWYPNTGGIVLHNNYVIEKCVNKGDISTVSSYVQADEDDGRHAVTAGIACVNLGQIASSTNEGAVSATGRSGVYVGGIVAQSYNLISYCVSNGEIKADGQTVYAGGIAGICDALTNSYGDYSRVQYCISNAKINVAANENNAYAGGVVGYVREIKIIVYSYDLSGNVVGERIEYYGGGVNNSFYIGECTAGGNNFGAIVGVCGANIYEINKYNTKFGGGDRFSENFYLNGFSDALGTTITPDGEFVSVTDKGATSASLEYIKTSETYRAILSELEKD